MKPFWLACVVACASVVCTADDTSGPNLITIQPMDWGSICYNPTANAPCRLDSGVNEYRVSSSAGKVLIQGSPAMGYRLSCDDDWMTISDFSFQNLSIQTKNGSTWSLKNNNGDFTWTSASDSIVFHRSVNDIRIQGRKGIVTMNAQPSVFTIQSPAGSTTVKDSYNEHSVSGVALSQIPYVGRGLYIPFHGVSLFIDFSKFFPVPELSGWVQWQTIQ